MPTNHTLLPHHRKELRVSGLNDDTIEACGFYSEDQYIRLAVLLGWGKNFPKKLAPALVFPFPGIDGQNGYCRIKPDTPREVKGKPIKYESPRGQDNQFFTPPGTRDVLDDAAVELLVTEGEKKAAKADQDGFPCIGLVGVYGWKTKRAERLLPALEHVEWKRRRVVIGFDSDMADNELVRDAEARLAAQLTNRGADVRVVRLPDGKDGVKQGLDDFLVAHGPGELRKLIDAATEPDPIDAVQAKVNAGELDPATEADEFLDQNKVDGVLRLRYWQSTFMYWKRGAYSELPRDIVRGQLINYLNRHATRVTGSVVSNIIDQIKAKSAVTWGVDPPSWLEGDEYWPADEIFAARNGLYHLPSVLAQKTPHAGLTPRLFTLCAVDYDVDFMAPRPDRFLAFLNDVWPGDPQAIEMLQDWFGYLLVQDTRQHKILMMVGPKRSGKGTIARVIRQLIGPSNVAGPTLSSLAGSFGLWGLIDKSIAIIPDARLSGRTDKAQVIERLLSISGEDCLQIERKNLSPLNMMLPTRLMLLSNELPRLDDASGALASRMLILRMTRSWFGRENQSLTEELLEELPGILLWAVVGWNRLHKRGRFIQPDSSTELVRELEELSSPVTEFVNEKCELGDGFTVSRLDLFESYGQFSRENGKSFLDDKAGFGRKLRAAFPTIEDRRIREDSDRVRLYVGIRLLTTF